MPATEAISAEKTQGIRPLLSSFAVSRTEGLDIPGRYCCKRHVWVVDGAGGTQPIVLAAKTAADIGALMELLTKTKMQPERDDQSFGSLVELATKTDARPERDDK
jgi:hypothetical protein